MTIIEKFQNKTTKEIVTAVFYSSKKSLKIIEHLGAVVQPDSDNKIRVKLAHGGFAIAELGYDYVIKHIKNDKTYFTVGGREYLENEFILIKEIKIRSIVENTLLFISDLSKNHPADCPCSNCVLVTGINKCLEVYKKGVKK